MPQDFPTHGSRKRARRQHPNMRERVLPQSALAALEYEEKRGQGDSLLAAAKRIRSSKRWQKKRRAILNGEPLCRPCKAATPRRLKGASQVDHIIPLQDALGLAFEDENLQPICTHCHALKTVRELRARRNNNPNQERST